MGVPTSYDIAYYIFLWLIQEPPNSTFRPVQNWDPTIPLTPSQRTNELLCLLEGCDRLVIDEDLAQEALRRLENKWDQQGNPINPVQPHPIQT